MSNPVVAVTVTANTKPYTTAMDQAALSTSKVDKASSGMVAGMARSAGAYAAAGVSIAAATGILKSSLTAATNLQDSMSKVGVVFGDSAGAIRDFADDTTKSFGLTKTAALDAASTFAIFGKSAGLSGGELTKFATDLTQRAVDLKSFFGGSVEDAITAIGAALRGESEPIRAYGVLLDDATLRNQALEMGLISSVKEGLTPQTRALAAAAEVMRQSADASGDYIRTQDGAANSIQNFNAAVGRMKEGIGTALLPALTEGAQGFAKLIDASNKWDEAVNNTAGGGQVTNWTDIFSLWGRGADDADALGAAAAGAAAGVDVLAASATGAAGAVGSMDEQMRGAIGEMNAFIDAQQGLAGSQRDMLGLENELRESAKQTTVTRSSGARKGSDAEAKAQQKVIDGIRKRDAAEQESEIKAARRRAQAKAEASADKGARRDVSGGVAGAIATDKAARAGQDIDGFNQNGSVGEATGSLSKGAQKRLEDQIDGIRARHKKALAAQLKGLKEATTAARSTGAAVDSYSFSLDKNTEAGRKNLEAISVGVDKAQAAAQFAYDAALLKTGSVEAAGKAFNDTLASWFTAISTSAENAGFARSEVEKFLTSLGLIPKSKTTTIDVVLNTAAAEAKAKKLGDKLKAIQAAEARSEKLAEEMSKPKPKKEPTLADLRRPRWDSANGGYSMFATGGEIRGPGSPTSDSVPIWASRGEFVVNAAQYSANRELVKAINAGSGAVAAGGGIQIGAVNVTEATASGVRLSVIDALAEAAYRNGAVR